MPTASSSSSLENGLRSSAHAARLATRPVERGVVARRDEHDGNVDCAARSRALHVEAGESVHVDVEDRAVGTARGERREKRFAGGEGGDLVVGKAQQAAERGANRRLVVDHGDIGTVTCHAANVTASRARP